MGIEIKNSGGINIVNLNGRLDITMSLELEKQFKGLLDSGADRILVDLGGLDFLSSSGLRIFIECAKRIKNIKGRLVFCSPSPSVLKVFKITQLDSVLDIYDGPEKAMSVLAQSGPNREK
jgi:anti-sigma B factor antagonist